MPNYALRQKSLIAAVIFVVCSLGAAAQQYHAAFGRFLEYPVGNSVDGILSGDFNGDRHIDLSAYGLTEITLLYNDRRDYFHSLKILRPGERIHKALSADCNRDGISDIFVLTVPSYTLKVFLCTRDTFKLKWAKTFSFLVENITLKDMNNDRNPDILLYGKKTLGMIVLLGYGDGTFGPPQSLLEEYSFSIIIPYDFNADRLMDLVGFHWVNNELLFFSAIGRMKFSIPSSVYLSSEPADFTLAAVDTNTTIDLIVVQKEPNEFQTFYGDGFGSFSKEVTIPLPSVPSRIFVDDVNGDGKSDAIIFSETDKNFFVYFNDSSGAFQRNIPYAAGVKPNDILLFRSTKEGKPHVALLDASSRNLIVFYNAEYQLPLGSEQLYALGVNPQGMIVFDVNNDGNQDLLVTNSSSELISLFLNQGDGRFHGQIPIPTEPYAESIHALRKNDSTLLCITVHPQVDKIVVTEVRYPDLILTRYALSTVPSPEILSSDYDERSGSLSLLIGGREELANSISIFEIQQREQKAILEKPFFQKPSLLAADICDMNRDGIHDVAFLAADTATKTTLVALSLGQQGAGFREPRISFSLPDTGFRNSRLWSTDLNGDVFPDLLLHYQSEDEYIAFAYGKDDSTFFPIPQRFSSVSVRNREDIRVIDIDGNGINDLVIANALTKMIQVFLAKKGGGFSKPKRLLSFLSGGGFAVSDFNRDGIPDYAVTYSESGVLRVLLGKE